MLGFGGNLFTALIGFGMSAAFITFICARLLCSRARTLPTTDELRSDVDNGLHDDDDDDGGVEPVVLLSAIPTVNYSKETFHSKEEDAQCAICLGDYQEKDILRIMPNCSHNFHLPCIDTWLENRWTCPICRLPLTKDSLLDASSTAAALSVSRDLQSNQEIRETTVSVVVESPQGEGDPESRR